MPRVRGFSLRVEDDQYKLGEDVAEVLEWFPASCKVIGKYARNSAATSAM
jgi:hypothetical protein